MKETKTTHGHLHILHPKNEKNHQLIQTHKYGKILQEHQHPTTTQKPKIYGNIQEQDKSGIYEFACNTCHMSYIGQKSLA
jgi:hypothetical protein